MTNFSIWLPKLSMFFGILSIILLSCDDYRKNIRKFISRWRYYLAGSIFVAINLFVYLVLAYAVVQQSPTALIFGKIDFESNYLNMLMPLILAFGFFGAGAGSFRLGNKDIQLNKKLQDVLEGMFNSKPLGPGDVYFPGKETEQLYEALSQKAERVEFVAVEKQWPHLFNQWKEFKEDEEVLRDQLKFLKTIYHELEKAKSEMNIDTPVIEKLSDVIKKIQDRIRNILKSMIKKAQKLLVAYAFKYYKDEAELERYLIDIEVLDPTQNQKPYVPSIVNRGLILGFVFGLLFGPLFGILQGTDVVYYCWRGAITMMLFTGSLSYGIHSGNWKKTLLVAGTGGYVAHLSWCLLDLKNLSAITSWDFSWAKNPHFWTDPIVGLCFGLATALILYSLKFLFSEKIKSKYALYAIATISGTILYPILYLLITNDAWASFTSAKLLLTASIGAIAMAALSITVNVAHRFASSKMLTSLPTEASASA